jgi:hypothetical protein
MPARTMDDVYREFARMYANGEPIRPLEAVEAAMVAAGKMIDDVTAEWLRSLRHDWVIGESDEPFEDERANRAYWRILAAE